MNDEMTYHEALKAFFKEVPDAMQPNASSSYEDKTGWHLFSGDTHLATVLPDGTVDFDTNPDGDEE